MAIRFDLLEYGQQFGGGDDDEFKEIDDYRYVPYDSPEIEDYGGHSRFFHYVDMEETNG